MEFDRNGLHILKYLWFYKLLSISCMILSSLGIPFGLYISYSRPKPYAGAHLNNALIGASIVLLGMGYVMYCLVKVIETFKREWLTEGKTKGSGLESGQTQGKLYVKPDEVIRNGKTFTDRI